jgi:ribonuclease P protein component
MKKAGFELVMKKGVKTVTPFFVFLHLPSDGTSQVGLITAKRNLPTAVLRNRYRRLIKESFRLHQHAMTPTLTVVIARKVEKSPDNKELLACLNGFWQKLTSSGVAP